MFVAKIEAIKFVRQVFESTLHLDLKAAKQLVDYADCIPSLYNRPPAHESDLNMVTALAMLLAKEDAYITTDSMIIQRKDSQAIHLKVKAEGYKLSLAPLHRFAIRDIVVIDTSYITTPGIIFGLNDDGSYEVQYIPTNGDNVCEPTMVGNFCEHHIMSTGKTIHW